MKGRHLPVDICSIKEYGLSKWREGFFWPVSDKDFMNLCWDTENVVREDIDTLPEDAGDLLLVQSLLRMEYWLFLHALKVTHTIQANGGKILCSDGALYYKDITGGGPIKDSFLKSRRAKYDANNHAILKKVEIRTKRLVKNSLYNPNILRLLNSVNAKTQSAACGPVSSLMKQYMNKKINRWVDFTSEADWLPKDLSYTVSKKDEDTIVNITAKIIEGLKRVAQKNGIELSDRDINYLIGLTQDNLTDASKMLYLIRKGAVCTDKMHLIAGNMGNSFIRSLCIAARERGGSITSFSHGGQLGIYYYPATTFSEFALSDEFVTYTRRSAELFGITQAQHSPIRGNRVKIESVETEEYRELWKRYGSKPLPKKIKKIMIIGSTHDTKQLRRPQAPGSFSPIHMDLELRVIDLLKKSDYEIIYKPHPVTILDAEEIFEKDTKVLSKGYFQDYLESVDAFLFIFIRTTAFPIALCTNKPIIAFKMDERHETFKPVPEAIELLSKRCRFVRGDFDERNRISFDEREFSNALNAKIKEPNNEFIEKYLFPENRKVRR